MPVSASDIVARPCTAIRGEHVAADGRRLVSFAWLPAGGAPGERRAGMTDDAAATVSAAPRAVILLLHGFGEHAARYEETARELADEGYAVHALDHRNHGASGGRLGWVESPSMVPDDFLGFARSVRALYPGVPLVLLGHSMGGVAAAHVALAAQDEFSGLVLSAPFLAPTDSQPAVMVGLLGVLARVLPTLPVRRIPSAALSRQPEEAEAYDIDPLVFHGATSARTAWSLLEAGRRALERAGELTLPLLVLHGGADTVASPRASAEFADRAGSGDKRHRMFPEARHEVLNDLDRKEFRQELRDWLAVRFPRQPV